MRQIKNIAGLVGVIGITIAIASCGKGELTPRESAIQSMTATTQKVKNANQHVFINPLSSSGSSTNSQSTSANTHQHGKPLTKALGQAKQSPIWKALQSDPGFNRVLRAAEERAPTLQSTFGEVDTKVKYLMENLLTNPVETNGVTVYTPDAKAICSNVDESDQLECETLLKKVTIEQHLTDATSGKLLFKYETKAPFAIGYAPNQYYLEFYLSDAIAVIDELGADNPADSTVTATGTIRFSIAVNENNEASIGFGIMEATDIVITETYSKSTMKLAKASDALLITADEGNHKGSVALNFGSIDIKDSKRIANTWKDSNQVTSEKITGTISLTINNDMPETISIKGFSFGESGLVTFFDGKKFSEIIVENPDTSIKFIADETKLESISVDYKQASSAKIEVTLSSTSTTTLKSSATSGTLASLDSKTDELKVTSGEIKMSLKTTDSAGAVNFDITVAAGQCANEKNGKMMVYSC